MTRAIIHVDMDAFYAAVEQRDHPAYRGRPVIVGADPRAGKGRGGVAACSYEARIFGIVRHYTDLVEPLSIDEAFLDVTGSRRLFGEAVAIGERIKAEIREHEGLTASVGGAPNKFLAKIASDLEKPDGFVVVRPEEVEAFLRDLPVARLWGVGEKTGAILRGLGIQTIGELSRWPEEALCRRL